MSARYIEIEPEKINTSPTKARPINLSEKDISRLRSLISAPLKGITKELGDIGSFFVPLVHEEEPFEEREKLIKGAEKAKERFEQGPLETALPTQDKFLEKALERTGRILPTAAIGPGGLVRSGIRSILSGVAGQAVEESGGGPLAQGIAEAGAFAAPGLARKIIPSNAEQKSILELGRKFGLSEEQLAPLMSEDLKRRTLGKIASVGEKTSEKLREMRKGGSAIYKGLRESPEAAKFLNPQNTQQFSTEMNKLGKDMPYAVRSQLQKDAADLVSSARGKGGISGEDLINFYKDVSSRYNIGRSELELFKGPIKKAIASIDPELGKNFETANKIWSRQAKISKTLTPGELDNIINLGEVYGVGAAVATGNESMLLKIIGLTGVRRMATEMLTSPRLQNLTKQAQHAIEKNQLSLLKKVGNEIMDMYKEQKED